MRRGVEALGVNGPGNLSNRACAFNALTTIVAAALFAPARTDSPRVWTGLSPILMYDSQV